MEKTIQELQAEIKSEMNTAIKAELELQLSSKVAELNKSQAEMQLSIEEVKQALTTLPTKTDKQELSFFKKLELSLDPASPLGKTADKEIQISRKELSEALALNTYVAPEHVSKIEDAFGWQSFYDVLGKYYVSLPSSTFALPTVGADWTAFGAPVVNPAQQDVKSISYTLLKAYSTQYINNDYADFSIQDLNIVSFAGMENQIRIKMDDAVENGVVLSNPAMTIKGLKDATSTVTITSATGLTAQVAKLIKKYGKDTVVVINSALYGSLASFSEQKNMRDVIADIQMVGVNPSRIAIVPFSDDTVAYVIDGRHNFILEKAGFYERTMTDLNGKYIGLFYYGVPALDVTKVTKVTMSTPAAMKADK